MPLVTQWKASYYCNTKKSWIYGSFAVFPQFVQFTEDGKSDIIDFKIYFDEFVEMKKETTNIIYTALTIRVNDNKYWFSSFPSCTNVYNMLEHFWKEKLFSGSKTQSGPSSNSRGQQMLRILHDSADCLSSTAKTLETQGQQIDGACRTMNKLHNDLGIAEKLIHDMDSWLSQFNVAIDDVMIDMPDAPEAIEKTELPVLYGPTDKDKHFAGSLVVSKKNLEVLDLKRNTVHSFNAREISEGTFHTPYEVTLTNSEIGKPPVYLHMISARLVHVMTHLQAMLGPKLNFEDPSDGVRMEDSTCGDNKLMENLKLDALKKESISSPSKMAGSQPVSSAEAAQMSKLLQDMKSMAVGIKDEQDRQLKQLDLLTNSVDKANARLRKDNITVNHLK